MTAPGRPVDVRYVKHPATPHWQHRMRLLGEDGWGVWLGVGDGRLVRKGEVEWRDVGRDFVQVVVPGAWWTAMVNEPGFPVEVYVDVVSPAVWDGGVVTMVDLDLDVVRTADGEVLVVDEDEFELHRRVLGYPEDWVARAPAVAAEVAGMLAGDEPSLLVAGRRWLAAQRGAAGQRTW